MKKSKQKPPLFEFQMGRFKFAVADSVTILIALAGMIIVALVLLGASPNRALDLLPSILRGAQH